MHGETGPLFIYDGLPQPAERPQLAPILGHDAGDDSSRRRADTPARLAIHAKASAGSGLIDLDEVAQALEHAPAQTPPEPEVAVVAAQAVPMPAGAPRSLLLTSVVLLGLAVGLLGWVASG